jgi:hypothetical protein
VPRCQAHLEDELSLISWRDTDLRSLMSKTELANAITAQAIPVDLNAQVWEPV